MISREAFYFALAAAFIYLAVTVAETTMYQLRVRVIENQQTLESQISGAQRANALAQQLVQRVSIESVHDKALADMLKKYGVKVVVTGPDGMPTTNSPTSILPLGPTNSAANPAPPALPPLPISSTPPSVPIPAATNAAPASTTSPTPTATPSP